jgi:hypothetical protein
MAASTVTMMIGAVLVYDGISDLCVVVHLRNTTKRFRRDVADYFGQMQEDARDGVVYTEDAKEED